MPYVPGLVDQKDSTRSEVVDVYKSSNVFVNNVPVALYRSADSTNAAVLNLILSPEYAIDSATIAADGEEDEKVVEEIQQDLVAQKVITQEELNAARDIQPGATDLGPGVAVAPPDPTSTVNTATTTFSNSYPLTPNTTLGDITQQPNVVFGYTVKAQSGLTIGQVVENLQLLTQNCIEPIKVQYPNMFVTNSFRDAAKSSSTSQHPKGMACDMQFANVSKADYFTIAIWIRDNISYDQLLLEYKTTGSKLPWIHISYNKDGNRNQVLTFMNDKRYAIGLVDLSAV